MIVFNFFSSRGNSAPGHQGNQIILEARMARKPNAGNAS
jgi:hypothetical protein